jgi:acylphosphatase
LIAPKLVICGRFFFCELFSIIADQSIFKTMPLYQLEIRGRVQGVSYRYATQKRALELGLCGWVKNQPDGTVYAEIEGEQEALQTMIDWCWQGPTFAKVEEVKAVLAPGRNYTSFEIIR